MNLTIEKCKGCSRNQIIVNKTHCLCLRCNKKRLSKKSTSSKISTSTKNRNFYHKIWKQWLHETYKEEKIRCVECRTELEEYASHHISHILSRGAYPNAAYDEDNVVPMCFHCHKEYEFGERIKMKSYKLINVIRNLLIQKYNKQK